MARKRGDGRWQENVRLPASPDLDVMDKQAAAYLEMHATLPRALTRLEPETWLAAPKPAATAVEQGLEGSRGLRDDLQPDRISQRAGGRKEGENPQLSGFSVQLPSACCDDAFVPSSCGQVSASWVLF